MDDNDGEYLSYDYASYKKRVARELDSDASEDSDFYYCDSDLESNRSQSTLLLCLSYFTVFTFIVHRNKLVWKSIMTNLIL